MPPRIHLYDTTLRDGAQTRGVDFSVKDKITIAGWLDALGIAYIEAGWPGANPSDDAFFAAPPVFKKARLTAFGMTRRSGRSAANDPALRAVLDSPSPSLCLFGKTWDYHATNALGVTLDENLELIRSSIAEVVRHGKEALFDAEHFFDGYKANAPYALACLHAAREAGARWIVLCDTNGGNLPHEIEDTVRHVAALIPGENLGIHCHDDTGNGIANSLAAVRAGCRMVQGTLNGLGERCGNANLVSLIPTLTEKMGFDVGLSGDALAQLTALSRKFDALLDREPNAHAPYVGASAFAHKGGIHASAVAKDPRFYEHIDPSLVGNRREIIMSNQAGQSNVRIQLQDLGIKVADNDPLLPTLLAAVKQREHEGYAYDHAAGSFAVLALRLLGRLPVLFTLQDFAVRDEGSVDATGAITMRTNAKLKLQVGPNVLTAEAEGNGPVHALDCALRQALLAPYPAIADVQLTDYHVRIIDSGAATGAKTRVLLESTDAQTKTAWITTGVSTDIISASLQALTDAYVFKLTLSSPSTPNGG